MNKNPQEGWPVIGGAAQPDALVVMMFDSEESKAKIAESEAWKEAAADDIGFCSHFEIYEVDRRTWIAEPELRTPFHAQT
ncbi:hypothetical protein ACW14X_28480 [Nocardioides sp. YJ-D4]